MNRNTTTLTMPFLAGIHAAEEVRKNRLASASLKKRATVGDSVMREQLLDGQRTSLALH